jgi:hypothetical protein
VKQIILAIALLGFGASIFAAQTQKVCANQTDSKTKKVKQVCKEVKVHKKLEPTVVPDKKAK